MGDVGSLALGGALGTVAILIKQELLLPIVGGVFVLEALSVIIQVASFKLTRQARLPDGAHPPPLRADRLARAESHHAIPDRRDHLRAVQSDDAEAEVMTMAFSVAGKHVVVMGAGRSGRAAASLLVSRGARVTLADSDPARISSRATSTASTWRSNSDRIGRACSLSADLVVLSPGVAPTDEAVTAAARAGMPVIGEVELASRWLQGRIGGRHGHEGQVHDDDADRADSGRGRASRDGRRQSRHRAQRAGRRRREPDAIHVVEVSSFQLEMTDTFHPWIAVLVNLSPDHLDRHASFEEYAAREGAECSGIRRADDWAVVNADDPASMELARRGTARSDSISPLDATLDERRDRRGRPHRAARRRRRRRRSCLSSSVRLPGRHLLGGRARRDRRRVPRRRADRGHAPSDRRLSRSRACARGRRRHRRRAVRQRLEGDERRRGACARSRRSTGDVVAIVGGRYKGGAFEDLRDLAPAPLAAVVAIGEAAPRIEQALAAVLPVERAGVDERSRPARLRADAAGRRRASRARVFELRHVRRLRRARTGVPGRSGAPLRRAHTRGDVTVVSMSGASRVWRSVISD